MIHPEDVNRFQEIMDEIKELVDEAGDITSKAPGQIDARAKAYWHAQILGTVDGNASMHSMKNTLKEFKDTLEEFDDEEFDDPEYQE